MAVIMPLNIHETSHTVLKPREEHFSNVIGNSYILHTAQAYILFSQFLYFWPNRTESFESRKKTTQYKRLEQLLEGLRFPPPPHPLSVPPNWDTLEIFETDWKYEVSRSLNLV